VEHRTTREPRRRGQLWWLTQICCLVASVGLGGVAACSGADGSDNADSTGDAVTAAEVRAEVASFCENAIDCHEADDAETQECMRQFEEDIAAAEGHGCLEVVADWISCLNENSECVAPGEYTDNGACHDQVELAEDCLHGRL